MEHMEAMVDLVRALSKKCDDFDYHKKQHDNYYKWYKESQEEVYRLTAILKNEGIEH
jgi:hypothetical protein